jgi:hypothetical protein
MLNGQGEIRLVDTPDVPSLIEGGYRVPTPQELVAAHTRAAAIKEQSGPLGALKAGTEGALDALTLGGSTAAEVGSGISTPENIRLREQLHPVAHGLGTAAGIIAPLAIGDEAPLAAATAPSLIAKAGNVAKGAVESALGTEGIPSLGRRLVVSGASKAAQGSLEGALYGLGADNHEAALGEPAVSGENVARVGLTALLGGALGGAGGVLGELATSVAPTVAKALNRVRESQYATALGVKELGPEERQVIRDASDNGWITSFSSPQKVIERANDDLTTKVPAIRAKALEAVDSDRAIPKPDMAETYRSLTAAGVPKETLDGWVGDELGPWAEQQRGGPATANLTDVWKMASSLPPAQRDAVADTIGDYLDKNLGERSAALKAWKAADKLRRRARSDPATAVVVIHLELLAPYA